MVEEATKVWAFKNTLPRDLRDKADTWSIASGNNSQISALITHMKSLDRYNDLDSRQDSVALYTAGGNTKYTNSTNKKIDKTNMKCNYCKKPGHFWRDCLKKKEDDKRKKKYASNNSYKQKALMAQVTEDYNRSDRFIWVIDSGASKHMTPYKDWLVEYEHFDDPVHVSMGNGSPILAHGQGSIWFKKAGSNYKMQEVLYVPQLKQNLFSVRQCTKNGYRVEFAFQKAIISKPNFGKFIGFELEKSLYAIRIIPLINIKTAVQMDQQALVGVPLEEWHRRFAHSGLGAIKQLISTKAVTGLEINNSPKIQCYDCAQGKICRKPHPSRYKFRASLTESVLHIDTCGPIGCTSYGGNKYFVLATEEYSGYMLIEFVETKSEIPAKVKLIITQVSIESKRPVKAIITDNGTEFKNRVLKEWLNNEAILHYFSAPYTPEQNGVAERANRTIIEGTRVLLNEAKLPKELWPEAAMTVVYTTNRLLSPKGQTCTRYELYTGRKPDVGNLRSFGQWAVVLTPKSLRTGKWTNKGEPYRQCSRHVMPYSSIATPEKHLQIVSFVTEPDFAVIPSGSQVKRKKSVKFNVSSGSDETVVYGDEEDPQPDQADTEDHDYDEIRSEASDTSLEVGNSESQQTSSCEASPSVNSQIHGEILSRFQKASKGGEEAVNSARSTMRPLFVKLKKLTPQELDKWQVVMPNQAQIQGDVSEQGSVQTGQDKDTHQPSDPEQDHSHHEAVQAALLSLHDEPLTVEDARNSEDWCKWKSAMDEELDALAKNKTWVLVPRPPGKKVVKNKWVFKVKLNTDGSVARHKARLVAKGYSQIPDVDYKETFAPVASMNTIRILFAIANQRGMEVSQFDVKTAFLHGDLEETIYMECPEGYEHKGDKVCKLIKSLYGLKQAPRQWNIKFDNFLKEFKLRQSIIDQCLYYNEEKTILLAIYVDDGLVAAKDKKLLDKLVRYLRETFELTVMSCEAYLGFQVIQDKSARTLKLQQSHYVDKILDRFKMQDCNPIGTPEEVGVLDTEDSQPLGQEYPFKEVIGSLLYLVTCTRPDIAHAVSIASRTSTPTIAHWKLIKRILRYLKGTRELGISFRWEKNPEMVGYSDADYANDAVTRRSTSGYCITYGGGPIAWRCQRQAIVSLSTTEAEYISGCELVKELLPIREMMIELGQIKDEPVRVLVDNQSTVSIAKNTGGQQRTKHIDVRQKWLSEQNAQKKIKVEFIPGKDQVADILTKPLHKSKFIANRAIIMTAIMMMLWILCVDTRAPSMFSPASPVYYEPTEMPYFTGNKEYYLSLTIMNPCNTYIRDITPDVDHNDKLISQCDELFKKRTTGILKSCDVKSANFSTATRIKAVKPSAVNNEIVSREKRVAPFVVAFFSILASTQTYSTIKSEITASNLEKMLNSTNESKKLLEQGYRALNTTRFTIHALNDRIAGIEEKLDFLDSKMDAYPRIMALVNEYDKEFQDVESSLQDIDLKAETMKVSSKVQVLIKEKLWVEPASDWAHLIKCQSEVQDNHFKLNYHFDIPMRDEAVKIFQSNAFRFWNISSEGHYCWMQYTGPRYVLQNTSNNCFLDIQEYWLHQNSLTGQPCRDNNKALEPPHKLFHTKTCRTKITPSRRDIQIKRINGFNRIYCWGHNITLKNTEVLCPDYVFELPLSEGFELNKERYTALSQDRVMVNTLDVQFNRDINNQLNTKSLKIYGTNLTTMDNDFNVLDKLFNSLGGDVQLRRLDLPKFLTSPFTYIVDSAKNLWQLLEKGLLFAAIVFGLFVLMLAVPVLNTVWYGLKSLKKAMVGAAGALRFGSVKRSRRLRNGYWDDSNYVTRSLDD